MNASRRALGSLPIIDLTPFTTNGTEAARMLLSTIYRIEQMSGLSFGAGHLIDVLRGKTTDKVKQFFHERVSTFGGVPAMVMQVIDSPDFAKRDTSSVRAVAYGGAPAPPDLVRRQAAASRRQMRRRVRRRKRRDAGRSGRGSPGR